MNVVFAEIGHHENMFGDPVNPDSKIHGVNMGPTWVLSAPGGPQVGHMNLTIREV